MNHAYPTIAAMLCVLFLTGCSKPTARETGQEHGDAPETAVLEDIPFTPETTEEDSTEPSAEQTLARLIKDPGLRDCVWYAADIHSQDTEETILHKLHQCEELVLKKPSGDSALHSLEDLPNLPNLKSLSLDFDAWNDSSVADFTPIAGLPRLERLSIQNHAKEETDLSFLAEMPHVTELYLPNCQLKDITFLQEMTQLERLSLYETKVEDLAGRRLQRPLWEKYGCGNPRCRQMRFQFP